MQVYRALEHRHAKSQCKTAAKMNFPADVQGFAAHFAGMQTKRHDADYNPKAKFYKSAVKSDIIIATYVMGRFDRAPYKHRRAFSAWVLLREPRDP